MLILGTVYISLMDLENSVTQSLFPAKTHAQTVMDSLGSVIMLY